MYSPPMPRGPRLDLAGALHHVMVRGLNRQPIFCGDADREDFIRRLDRICQTTGLRILAWALLPNHLHLLARTGHRPLSVAMLRLLTGYAIAFNRRHRRTGHLFQNRYKSILVEEDLYMLELVRYIHLNPTRTGDAPNVLFLDGYPWTGHSALMGNLSRPWQATDEILALFGKGIRRARRAYRTFVEEGVSRGRRPELQGGGLVRSAGGWDAVEILRRGREAWSADERILGSSDFVIQVRQTVERAERPRPSRSPDLLSALIERIAEEHDVTVAECCGGSRRRPVVSARRAISHLAVEGLGFPATTVARVLGVSVQAILVGVSAWIDQPESKRQELHRFLDGFGKRK
jgi:putative transposase